MSNVWVRNIQLTDFRNYVGESVTLDPGLNLFLGKNAQGKTNLLEAIYIASAGRSYRASSEAELVRSGRSCYRVVADVQRRPVPVKLEVSYSTDGRKLVRLNGTERIRAAELSSFLNVVMFTPDDLSLVKGSPSVRRRFLDLEISQVSPAYRQWINTYSKVMTQRNALLKQAAGLGPRAGSARVDSLLEAWDEQLVDIGAKITARRRQVVASLDELGREAHYRITGTSGALAVKYVPSIPIEPSNAGSASGKQNAEVVDWIANRYRARLRQLRRVELIRGVTMVGPHRDDITFLIDEMDVATYGSQGQQRSTVLAVKLAEMHFIEAHTGDMPVLLLDDVLSELDKTRRINLLGEIVGGHQALVTSVEPGCRDLMPKGAKVFTISAGEVTPDDVADQSRAGEDYERDGIHSPYSSDVGDVGVER